MVIFHSYVTVYQRVLQKSLVTWFIPRLVSDAEFTLVVPYLGGLMNLNGSLHFSDTMICAIFQAPQTDTNTGDIPMVKIVGPSFDKALPKVGFAFQQIVERTFRGSQVATSHLWWCVYTVFIYIYIYIWVYVYIYIYISIHIYIYGWIIIFHEPEKFGHGDDFDLWSQNHHPNTKRGLRWIRWAFQLDIVDEFFNQENQLQGGAPVSDEYREVGANHSNFTMVYGRYIDILTMVVNQQT